MRSHIVWALGLLPCTACGPGLGPEVADGSSSSSSPGVGDEPPGVSETDQASPTSSTGAEGSTGPWSCVVRGDVTINSQESLAAMEGVCEVEGNLRLAGPHFSDIESLSGLTRVGGHLSVSDCTELGSLAPLAGLTAVEGTLILDFNPMLDSFEGVGGVDHVGGLYVGFADDLDGLAPRIELDTALAETGEIYLSLRRIATLRTLDELPALSFANVDRDHPFSVQLDDIPLLTSLDRLDAYPLDGGELILRELPSLGSLSGPVPVTLGMLELSGLDTIVDVGGLESIEHVGSMLIYGNEALTSSRAVERTTARSGPATRWT